MKLMVICYNVAIHEEVMDVLKETGIKNYTRFERAQGVGDLAGPHLGTNIWPAVNSVLAVAVEDDKKDRLIERIKELRKKLGKEGIKAFVLPLEEIT
jgi:nitrogen regulatory protein PII